MNQLPDWFWDEKVPKPNPDRGWELAPPEVRDFILEALKRHIGHAISTLKPTSQVTW